ncbi:MAG: DUF4393 domain-containing protein [Planctomycetaceae bacterium]|nr:DUF4393 domain-containing protein [Planctomycetaceae bacterium]
MTSNDDQPAKGPLIGDLAGAGQIINSEVAKKSYDDALSPAMQEVGGLTKDALKTFRLFTAPLQLAAAYQDRFAEFCERVRTRVPPENQREAPPEIAAPVMQAFATTSDDSPLMSMFEELMAKAIDINTAEKLSPTFPSIIKGLSPLQAKLIKSLARNEQFTDAPWDPQERVIHNFVKVNFEFDEFGGQDHHLTLTQDLGEKKLVTKIESRPNAGELYPQLQVADGLQLLRLTYRLSMFGKWFASACVHAS